MKRTKIFDLLKTPEKTGLGIDVLVKGWVRTRRGNKKIAFIAVNDGSIVHSIQVVADIANFSEETINLKLNSLKTGMEPFVKDSTIPAVITTTIKDARNKINLTILSLLNILWGHCFLFQ